METRDPRTLAELISALTGDLATLVRQEFQLVRAEASEKISVLLRAIGGVAVGAAVAFAALIVLLQVGVSALSRVMDPILAGAIVGGLAALTGYLLIKSALARFDPANLTPDRSTRQLQKDIQLVKEQVQ
jgi:hypothetical protein